MENKYIGIRKNHKMDIKIPFYWHTELAIYNYPENNIYFQEGIKEIDREIYINDYLVGFWKIKKLKQ